MPKLYDEDIKEESSSATAEEGKLIGELFEYVSAESNPFRVKFLSDMAEQAQFKELHQWSGADEALLTALDVPAVPIDRINRGIDTIDGIRFNTNTQTRIVKRELGDERIATILDRIKDHVEYAGDFSAAYDDVFDSQRDFGLGIFKVGFDPQGAGGQGEIWLDAVNVEDFWYSRCKKKTLEDISWAAHRQMMYWEDAIHIDPEKAGLLKGLKTLQEAEWEKMKGDEVKGNATANDYGTGGSSTGGKFSYENQVSVWEFWVKRRVPIAKIGFMEQAQVVSPDGMQEQPKPSVRSEKLPYEPQEGEKLLAKTVLDEWHQYIVATGNEKKGGVILAHNTDDDHPFIGEMAEKKRSGQPRGYIEKVIPHQRRINIAWAQKTAFNNKAIKAPLTLEGATGSVSIDEIIQTSRLGSILILPIGVKASNLNQTPNIDLQAIEEGASARQDMDFASAATEDALRGVSAASSSGIKLSLQQNAAVTPLSKYVRAEQSAKKLLMKKVLKLIIKNFDAERMMRIIGQKQFITLAVGELDPQTGQPLEELLQFTPDVVNYDVIVEDLTISDFNKQQSFNATETLAQGGIPFTDDFRIKNAPIKNIDDALVSNEAARQDIIKMLMMQVQMLQEELGQAVKEAKSSGGQKANAQKGRSASQAGKRSMVGGTSPKSSLG